jgi:hypothetical protein
MALWNKHADTYDKFKQISKSYYQSHVAHPFQKRTTKTPISYLLTVLQLRSTQNKNKTQLNLHVKYLNERSLGEVGRCKNKRIRHRLLGNCISKSLRTGRFFTPDVTDQNLSSAAPSAATLNGLVHEGAASFRNHSNDLSHKKFGFTKPESRDKGHMSACLSSESEITNEDSSTMHEGKGS